MRLIDADELIHTTGFAIMFASMFTTDKAERKILKKVQNFFKERVDNAPTIKAEPIEHGEWLESESGYSETENIFYCSQCKDEFIVHKGDRIDFNYCPHCGVKMDGGKLKNE